MWLCLYHLQVICIRKQMPETRSEVPTHPLLSCMTLDESFAFSFLLHKIELIKIVIPTTQG